ncbi:unnamed protein product, partial [Mesorhabditis belari]|uniref:Nanos-type domain-containing protein n=1 Tax=Mesorhabditis belari TaxID=2138241 RepID=A0AAF3J7Y3_9BILA
MLDWDRDFFVGLCASRNSTEVSDGHSSSYGTLKPEVDLANLSQSLSPTRSDELPKDVEPDDGCWMSTIPAVPMDYMSNDSSIFEDDVFSEGSDPIVQPDQTKLAGEPTIENADELHVVGNPLFSDHWTDYLYGPMAFVHRSGEPDKFWLEYRRSQPSFKLLKVNTGTGVEYPILEKAAIPHLKNNLEALHLPTHIMSAIETSFNKVVCQRPFSLDFDYPSNDTRLNTLHLEKLLEFSQLRAPRITSLLAAFSPSEEKPMKLLPESIDHGSYAFKSVDGAFNPHDSCDFCYGKAMREAIAHGKEPPERFAHGPWFGHRLRDKKGDVLCPRMFAIKCYTCGATGKGAHTYSHCPFNRHRLLGES